MNAHAVLQAIGTIMLVSVVAAFAGPPPGFSWHQTFIDEFNGSALDTTKWSAHDHFCGTRNSELQAYVPENVLIQNGLLRLKLEKRAVSYSYCGNPTNTKSYASGIIISQGKFAQKYGYWEINCKLPRGKSAWPAFWGLPEPYSWPPEFDVFEHINGGDGANTCVEHGWIHANNYPACTGGGNGGSPWMGAWCDVDMTSSFHNIGMLWTPDSVAFFVNGMRSRDQNGLIPAVKQYQNPNCAHFMLVNLALSQNNGGPAASTDAMMPVYFDVDWIKVWQYGTVAASARTASFAPQAAPVCANGIIRTANGQSVELTDLNGRVLLSHKANGAQTISIAGFAQGAYILKINQNAGSSLIMRISK